jgi:hypothetical protein
VVESVLSRLTSRLPRARHPLTISLLLLTLTLPLLYHLPFFSTQSLLYSTDAAQLHFPRYQILCDSLQREHALPLWQTLLYGGSPFHANPENPTLYPPVLLLAAFLPPVLTINVTILLHLCLAAGGMYFLILRLWRRIGWQDRATELGAPLAGVAGAFVGSVIFSLNFFTRVDHLNLVTYGAAHALIPWIFLAADDVLHAARPWRATGRLALLLALQFFTGGLYVLPYSCLALVLWFVFLGLLGDAQRRRRTLRYGALAGLLGIAIVLAKLLPYREWAPTTNRGGRLPYEEALGTTLGGHNVFEWGAVWKRVCWYTGNGLALLPALFVLPLARSGAVRVVLFFIAFFFAVSLGGPVHRLLYETVPLFDSIRSAVRAWTGVNAFLPVAAGLGVAWLCSRWRQRSRYAVAIAVALGVLLTGPLTYSYRHEPFLKNPEQFDELLARYQSWPRAAELAGSQWRAVYFDKDHPDDRNEQFISTALGVETVAGYLGHVWPAALEAFLYGPPAARLDSLQRRRHLGTLSVRWLVTQDVSLPANPNRERILPFGVDGNSVYDNELFARERAIVPGWTCAIAGDPHGEVRAALLDVPQFPLRDASATVVSPAETGPWIAPGILDALVIVLPGAGAVHSEVEQLALDRGVSVVSLTLPLDEQGRAKLRDLASSAKAKLKRQPAQTLAFRRISSSRTSVARDSAQAGCLVVVSEPWFLYRGWTAHSDAGRALEIRCADGVSSSVFLRPGESGFEARYAPPSVPWGLAIGALATLVALLLCWRG